MKTDPKSSIRNHLRDIVAAHAALRKDTELIATALDFARAVLYALPEPARDQAMQGSALDGAHLPAPPPQAGPGLSIRPSTELEKILRHEVPGALNTDATPQEIWRRLLASCPDLPERLARELEPPPEVSIAAAERDLATALHARLALAKRRHSEDQAGMGSIAVARDKSLEACRDAIYALCQSPNATRWRWYYGTLRREGPLAAQILLFATLHEIYPASPERPWLTVRELAMLLESDDLYSNVIPAVYQAVTAWIDRDTLLVPGCVTLDAPVMPSASWQQKLFSMET